MSPFLQEHQPMSGESPEETLPEKAEKGKLRGALGRVAARAADLLKRSQKVETQPQAVAEEVDIRELDLPEGVQVLEFGGNYDVVGPEGGSVLAKNTAELLEVLDYLREEIERKRPEKEAYDTMIAEALGRVEVERDYETSVAPAAAGERLAPGEVASRLETDHVVKLAPRLKDQLSDPERSNEITYVKGVKEALMTNTSLPLYEAQRDTLTEEEALDRTYGFLEGTAAALRGRYNWLADKMDSMKENLTFIGEKEYEEATRGIADYWKASLESNPRLQIVPLGYREMKDTKVKSSTYMLDHVLAHFSQEELEAYKDRLLASPQEITATDPSDVRMVLLDDWTISGRQARSLAESIASQYPAFANSFEVQLVAAARKHITHGIDREANSPIDKAGRPPIVVRAYYQAHEGVASEVDNDVHITGAHCSADYGFETDFAKVVEKIRREGTDEEYARFGTLPPLANIVRPYRTEGYRPAHLEEFYQTHGRVASSK